MTRVESLIGLNLFLDIGSVRLKALLEAFGSPERVFRASRSELERVFGIGAGIAGKILSLKPETVKKELAQAQKLGLKIITCEDASYPQNLKTIPGYPIVLYIKGELKPEDKDAIAVVGSRRASVYGLNNAGKFSGELALKGFTVVSGLARGIDTAAHRGALKSGGRTLAVIGSGFNEIYPPENLKLAEEIARNGAVISEFPLRTPPLKENFPRRNRVISGLSLGTLVVEAARNSGALITADFALEQGREVFALPGAVDAVNSFGTNELIKQGAKLVSSVEEIIEEFALTAAQTPQLPGRQPAVREILERLSGEPVHIDELAKESQIDIPKLSAMLLGLRLKNLIRELPGRQFIRSPLETTP
jgi:DNA processing protein